MKILKCRHGARAACLALLMSGAVQAQNEGPLYRGGYLAPMATYIVPGGDRLEDGFGGTLGLGYRSDAWALELVAYQVGLDADGFSTSPDLVGGALNGLLFPFAALPNLYGIATVGGAELSKYPIPAAGEEHFPLLRVGAGVGHLFPLSFARYDFALRAEALYVAGVRDREVGSEPAFDAPRDFNDAVINLGLQLPFGLRADPPPPPPPEPVAIVAPVSICADTLDNDGDGQVDFPADPGCTAAEDGDETDPAVCADGKDNDGDGLIDFPADRGCAAADDPDEADPCKTPQPGERISLKGCGTGDIIVLRGVNFEFDQARLTVNARTILDNVAEELGAYPEIEVELSGHTDAKGSDTYNQALSERRVASVEKYLVDRGIESGRMTTVGEGEVRPVADNETDEGRELNRRVELKVTSGVAAADPAPSPGPGAEAPVP